MDTTAAASYSHNFANVECERRRKLLTGRKPEMRFIKNPKHAQSRSTSGENTQLYEVQQTYRGESWCTPGSTFCPSQTASSSPAKSQIPSKPTLLYSRVWWSVNAATKNNSKYIFSPLPHSVLPPHGPVYTLLSYSYLLGCFISWITKTNVSVIK